MVGRLSAGLGTEGLTTVAEEAPVERFAAMGTRVELHGFAASDAVALSAARRAIVAVDDALTIHRPSPLTALNADLLAGREATVDVPILIDALAAAEAAQAATFGLFDVAADRGTGGAWAMVRFDRARGTVSADRPLALDFGGLGKGIALDRAAAVLRAAGVASALLSAGESSILALGDHPLGGRWPFAIPHPTQADATLLEVELRDKALSISATVGAGAAAPERAAMIRPGDAAIVDAPCCTVAIAATGTAAEAMSTALLVADPARLARLLHDSADTSFRFDLFAVASQPTRMYA